MEYSNQHKCTNIKCAYIFELACSIPSHGYPKGLNLSCNSGSFIGKVNLSCNSGSFVGKQLLQCRSCQRKNSGSRCSASCIHWQIFVLYSFCGRGGARFALSYVRMAPAALLRTDCRQRGWKQEGQLGIC